MKENPSAARLQKRYCKLLDEKINAKICSEIKMLHTGFYREDLLDAVKEKTGRNEIQIMEICKSCPYFNEP